jgi:hypothetical protein
MLEETGRSYLAEEAMVGNPFRFWTKYKVTDRRLYSWVNLSTYKRYQSLYLIAPRLLIREKLLVPLMH